MKTNLVSLADLSRLTGKDYKTIKKRIIGIEPNEIKGKSHLYDSHIVLELLFSDKELDDLDLTQERAKLTIEQRKKTALERQQLEGKLMDIDFVVINYSKMAQAIRNKLLSIPTKLAPEMVGIESPGEAMAILQEHIHEVLEEISSDQFSADIGVEVDKVLAKIESITSS